VFPAEIPDVTPGRVGKAARDIVVVIENQRICFTLISHDVSLRLDILLHVAVHIQMVGCQICDNGDPGAFFHCHELERGQLQDCDVRLFHRIRPGEERRADVAAQVDGTAFRLQQLCDDRRRCCFAVAARDADDAAGTDIKKDLLKLSLAVLDAVLKLRETMMVLNYGSQKTLERAKDVEIAERIVDDQYRQLSIKVLSAKLETPVLLLLRDILQLLENSADKAEDAADAAGMLSMVM